MDAAGGASENPAMRRSRFSVYATANEPRWIVLEDIQGRILNCQRLEAATDLYGAMTTALERLAAERWVAEAAPEYGFVFIQREGERRLLMLTPHDPYSTAPQSFSPFGR